VLAGAEDDMLADGKSETVDGARRLIRLLIAVNSDGAEIMMEARLHEAPRRRGLWFSR
jgi:hypothetical protein